MRSRLGLIAPLTLISEGDVNLLASDEFWDPHAIAGLLKSFLRDLPASILTREMHLRFLAVIGKFSAHVLAVLSSYPLSRSHRRARKDQRAGAAHRSSPDCQLYHPPRLDRTSHPDCAKRARQQDDDAKRWHRLQPDARHPGWCL